MKVLLMQRNEASVFKYKQLTMMNSMANMKRSHLMAAAVMSLAVSCSSGSDNAENQIKESLPKVEIMQVSVETVPQKGEFTATVLPNVKNNIAPSMMLRIEDIKVEVGDHVEEGQLLVSMDDDNLLQQKTQLENLKVEFERCEALYLKGGVSKSEYDARRTSYEVAESAYSNLLENTRLMSPVSGIVTARNYDDGDMYNGQSPVLTVEQIRPVKLYINVSESLYTYVRKGMDVSVALDVYRDRTFDGEVTLVYPTVDPSTRTFTVEVKIPNRDELIRPGMFSRVTMLFGERDNVVVPDMAVVKQSGSGERFVYVYRDGKVSYNKVELGRRMGDRYEVLSGVSDGDMVVVAGQNRLFDGIEVEVVEPVKER